MKLLVNVVSKLPDSYSQKLEALVDSTSHGTLVHSSHPSSTVLRWFVYHDSYYGRLGARTPHY